MAKTNTTPTEPTAEELAVQEANAKELADIALKQEEKDAADLLALEKSTAEEAERVEQKEVLPSEEEYFKSNAKCLQLFFTADGRAFYTQDAAKDYANKNLDNKEVKTVTNPNI
jgi:hypothetical protein